jgi:hypothetical protein
VQEQLRKALDAMTEAAEAVKALLATAREAAGGDGPDSPESGESDSPQSGEFIPCTPKQLSKKLLLQAARTAVMHNPANAVRVVGASAALGADFRPLPPGHIAVMTQRYWGPAQRELTVSFMEQTPADLRDRILSHMNAWSSRCGISFKWTQSGGQVRISRGGGGYWSYLGTDIAHIPARQQTMNLQAFTMQTPESEYRRVVRHEVGHTLGMPHEHMRRELVARLVPEKVIAYFARHQGWDRQTVIQQVLTPLEDAEITAPGLEPTPADQDSIMCYQLSGEMTTDQQPIRGGTDINESDYAFAGKIYPKGGVINGGGEDIDWLLSPQGPGR